MLGEWDGRPGVMAQPQQTPGVDSPLSSGSRGAGRVASVHRSHRAHVCALDFDFVFRYHNTTRLRDQHVTTLSYWSDNAAGYSWWSMPGNNIDGYGPIGELFLRLHKEYLREGIMFGSWESDNTFGRINAINAQGKTAGGWCFEDWTTWNETLYPGGGSVAAGSGGWPAKMRALQNHTIQAPMGFCYYIYYLCHDNVWRRNTSSPFNDAFIDAGMWRQVRVPWARFPRFWPLRRSERVSARACLLVSVGADMAIFHCTFPSGLPHRTRTKCSTTGREISRWRC